MKKKFDNSSATKAYVFFLVCIFNFINQVASYFVPIVESEKGKHVDLSVSAVCCRS